MMNQEVRRIMTTDPLVARPQQSMKAVAQLMLNEGIQQMPVVSDEGKLLGLINYNNIMHIYAGSENIDQLLVSDVMDTKILKIMPKDKVGTAAELFADSRFKTLPVVNLRNELKGVITAFSLIKMAFNAEYKTPILYGDAFAS